MYPYRIRITDPVEIKLFEKVKRNRSAETPSRNVAIRIGCKIPKKIKRDGVKIKSGLFTITNELIKLEINPAYGNKKGVDAIAIFNSLLYVP